MISALVASAVLAASPGLTSNYELIGSSEKNMMFEFKLGPLIPLVDRAFPTGSQPYQKHFGGGAMVYGEIEIDRQFWQGFGSLGAGLSVGYGEKFGKAVDPKTGVPASDSTGLRLVPMKALAIYRFDVLARRYSVPLVPYAKAGLVVTPWWVVKGGEIEVVEGVRGEGVKFGFAGVLGLALELDFLDPRLARDFDTSAGVNHTYLFGEFALEEVTASAVAGNKGLDLSSRHFMFGLAFEF